MFYDGVINGFDNWLVDLKMYLTIMSYFVFESNSFKFDNLIKKKTLLNYIVLQPKRKRGNFMTKNIQKAQTCCRGPMS